MSDAGPGPSARPVVPSRLRTLTGWTIGPFGLKDVFTVVNLVSGVVAIHFALDGSFRDAGYAVIAGFLLGDLFDGAVARATRTGNRFGAQFDTIADHFVHVFVPGLVMYAVYARAGHAGLGALALALLVTGASIRHALFAAAPFEYARCFCGLPRTIVGFLALSFPLSRLFTHIPGRYVTGTLLVGVLSVLSVAPVPYTTHRGDKGMQWYVKLAIAIALVSVVGAFAVARSYFFDTLSFWVFVYVAFAWMPVSPDERRQFRAAYRLWAAKLRV